MKGAKYKIVIAITGASGSIYAKLLLEKLVELAPGQIDELAVVMSSNAPTVASAELGSDVLENFPVKYYDRKDFFAPFASGSAKFNAMVIIPCSMGTLGRIAAGGSDDLITRAADVMLKERRKLILCIREMPFNLIHIRNMETLTLAGGIICPASPSFYSLPKTIDELASTVTNRIVDLIGLNHDSFRWGRDEH